MGVTAMGMSAAAILTSDTQVLQPLATVSCKPWSLVLAATSWEERQLVFDIATLDRPSFMVLTANMPDALQGRDESV